MHGHCTNPKFAQRKLHTSSCICHGGTGCCRAATDRSTADSAGVSADAELAAVAEAASDVAAEEAASEAVGAGSCAAA